MELLSSLRNIESEERIVYVQKAKIQWAVEADENLKFFHGMINRKRRQLTIKGIKHEGVWVTEPMAVKDIFFRFFEEKFKKFEGVLVNQRSSKYKSLNSDQFMGLEASISELEVRDVVWACGSEKSPGPDGFSFAFYKNYWDLVKHDVMKFVREYFTTGKIPNGCKSSFITLIPKVHSPVVVSDYRLISLIGSQYKIIAKILETRLSRVIESIVSIEQSAFVKGWPILDGSLMVKEIMDWYKKKKKQVMIFKIVFEKAYDSVSWVSWDFRENSNEGLPFTNTKSLAE